MQKTLTATTGSLPCSVIPDSYTNPHSSRDARSEELTASKSVVDIAVCWHLKSLQMFADNEMFCICECSRRFPCGKNWRIQLLRLSERRFLCLRNVRMPLRTLARMLTQSTPAPVGVVGGRGGAGNPPQGRRPRWSTRFTTGRKRPSESPFA